MDFWSFSINDEVNAVILNREFAMEMEKMFAADLAESEEIVWEEWKKRPLLSKIRERVSPFTLPLALDINYDSSDSIGISKDGELKNSLEQKNSVPA